ncbi:unnamed protein product [Acanthoscelides obtectus]|uniref:DUF4806 domain-containing protein n=1 Tax=Acanthoscelides obtectus TaxID=200917 RepID=A0A9P0LQC1_ACAOB|nr:unnamed protein product [Acanthoscelides obtectus]CAK1654762.1 hypothetical protein AOBTE_LOCUS18824 [Acanthoscelides obtectus]
MFEGNHSAFEIQVINLLVTIKNQNKDIKSILLQNNKELTFELPSDFPVSLPIVIAQDINLLEEYLRSEAKLSLLILYLSKLGGRDITNKTNIILRRLISNQLAVRYSYLGTRQEKKAFKSTILNKVVIRAVLSGTIATEQEIEDAIKNG